MEELWRRLDPVAADAMRTVCRRLLADAGAFTDALVDSGRAAQNEAALWTDASLMEEDRQLNQSELVQWLTANIQHPGRRVEPYVGPRTTAYVRDLASRGIRPDFAAGWRAALRVAWRSWLEACLAQGLDPDVLADVLDVSAQSLVQYAFDSVVALRETHLLVTGGDAQTEAIAMIQLLASGAAVATDLAEARLSYRLGRRHLGLVVWADEPGLDDTLDTVTTRLRALVDPRCSLMARASATSRWLWLSGTAIPDQHDLEKIVQACDGVRAAVGRPGDTLDGFVMSHQDALAAQAMIIRLDSPRRFTAYADVELIDVLTQDRASARRFVLQTLGPLVDGEDVLREALLAYVQSGFSATQTAANLYAHRNTVERRVSRANELSTVKVEDNPTHVAAALMVLDLAPEIVTA